MGIYIDRVHTQRPKPIRTHRLLGLPVVVAGQIDLLPAQWREVSEVSLPGFNPVLAEVIHGALQVDGIP